MAGSNVSSVVNHFPTVVEGFNTTTSSSTASGATTISLTSVSGLTNGAIFVGLIEPGDAKEQAFTGTVDTSGLQITGVKWTRGSNVTHVSGSSVVDYTTGTLINMVMKGILTHTNQDGTLKDDSVGRDQVIDGGVPVLRETEYFTTSGTWTKPAGMTGNGYVIVELVGGGGSGGGGNKSSTNTSVGSGGGAGAYARKKVLAASLDSTETVTVGAGGAATTSSFGNNGTASSFGSHCSADPGEGGHSATGNNTGQMEAGQPGGASGTGDLVIPGGGGQGAFYDRDSQNAALSGAGGASYFGGGGRGKAANAVGEDGQAYGSGGGGAAAHINSSTTLNGGAGADGIVIVYEYY